ncbi:MAG TPA: ribosomal protein L7/L12 [Gemmata sp.]|nr:ribosomal protein L7/L12 [Gemmata sp.]
MFDWFGGNPDFTPDDAARLRRIEWKLNLILKHLGIDYREGDGELPTSARARADAGDKIGAIKAYREATGAGLAEAKRAVESYLGRARADA